ncbi:MAG: glycosyltransferase [Fibromonadaceae bacterium]|jgi:glycosyltransferase involved in cell wall biosynthesis|nr:glycosyltransferase [Fibromonadaceae bacterium]
MQRTIDRIAVLIPCYNESETITDVVKNFKEILKEASIYVYDNNSTDNTAAIAKEAGAIVKFEKKQGKGNVIRTMFRDIQASCYILVDGDNTYPAEVAKEMARLVLEEQIDMVVGDRLSTTYSKENKRKFHNLGNILVKKSINRLFKGNIADVMSGYRAFSYLFVKSFPVLSSGFEIETEMTIHSLEKRLNIVNLPIDYKDRPENSISKLNTFSDGIKILWTIFRLFKNYRPLKFFSFFAIALFILSTAFFIPVLLDFWETGLVAKFPTLFVCGITFIVAIQFFFSGLILSVIRQKNLQDFELKLIELRERI